MTKVAIIEDDQAIAHMYALKLENSGYEVKVASNGVEGLLLAKKFKPQLILLDIMMPEMTGDVMLEKLRATETGSSIRVIVLTNISPDEAPARLKNLQIDRFIVKANYTPTQVVDLVRKVLAQSTST